MKVSIKLGIALAVVCSVFALSSVSAEAACTNITSSSIPKTITASGCYKLSEDVTKPISSGYAINITASNVQLDLGGYSITNSDNANSDGVFGINVGAVSNVTIKNGSIVNFHGGIQLEYPDDQRSAIIVDNITVDFKTAGRNGGDFWGKNVTVSNCRVYGNPSVTNNSGFTGTGPNVRFINNVITDINEGNSFDVGGVGLVLDNNMIQNSTLLSGAGIHLGNDLGNGVVLTRNTIINKEIGILGEGTLSGIYRDNITTGCTTSYDMPSSMVNAGNNQ